MFYNRFITLYIVSKCCTGVEIMKIAFIAPDDTIFQTATSALAASHSDIIITKGLLSQGVEVGRQLAASGFEVVITRGGTAALIRDTIPEVSVVDVIITGFDIIRAVEQAKAFGNCIGVVAFPSMLLGIDCLESILGVDLRPYPIASELEAETTIRRAIAEGSDVVLGGVITATAAKQAGFPCVMVTSGREGIVQAALEAKRLAHARQLEKVKAGLFKAVIDFGHEGVISVDHEQRVTIFNPTAQQITGIEESSAIGHHIDKVWPELKLGQVFATGRDDLGQILRIGQRHVLCNKVPIIVNNHPVGAVANLQDVSKIQKLEARIRQEIYDSGHVASYTFTDVLGTSPLIQDTIRVAKEFAAVQSAILILGETGAGKEVFAQSIHNYSQRAHGPFVAINCAALPSQILESELFGYVAGAFTGANKVGKPGLFEIAHGGTIFLDEIAEMDYIIQGKLLRVLQEKKVVRLGSDRVIPVDVRVIAATNKNLKQLVLENRFRADLYYRLNVLRLRIPPLRDRSDDIAVYARHFIAQHAQSLQRHLALTTAAVGVLRRYPWPGNVRELQNTLERAAVVCPDKTVDAPTIAKILADEEEDDIYTQIQNSEADEIKKALTLSRGKYGEAAKLLGISRSTLWRKLRQTTKK
jgi:PAS domain S-box-containing protein